MTLMTSLVTDLINGEKKVDMTMFETDLEWYAHVKDLYVCTRSVEIRSFIYNFNMRNLATNKYLHKVKIIESPLCNKCKQKIDSIYHMFWECAHIQSLWVSVNQWLGEMFHLNMVHSSVVILMHVLEGADDYYNILNFVYVICKRLIYINRESPSPIKLSLVINSLRKYEMIERNIALKNKQLQRHSDKWLDLYNLWSNEE